MSFTDCKSHEVRKCATVKVISKLLGCFILFLLCFPLVDK